MTKQTHSLRLRKLVFVPASLVVLGITTSSDGGERRVHVQGGKMLTQMQNGKMVLKGIQGDIGGGQVVMAGNVAAGQKSNNATVKFADVPLAEAAVMVGQEKVAGWLGDLVVTGFIKGEWQGKGLTEITRTADGALVIQTGPGVISDPAALARIAKATGVPELQELKYNSAKVQARATDGKIAIDFIRAEGPEFKLQAKGTYDAGSDNLDLDIEATVSQELAAKSSYMKLNNVMSFLRGEEKETSEEFVSIPRLQVSGEFRKPTVTLDKPAVASAAPATTSAEQKPAMSANASLKRASEFFLSQSTVPAN